MEASMTEQEQAEAVVVGLAGFKVERVALGYVLYDASERLCLAVSVLESLARLEPDYVGDKVWAELRMIGDTMSTHERELSLRHD